MTIGAIASLAGLASNARFSKISAMVTRAETEEFVQVHTTATNAPACRITAGSGANSRVTAATSILVSTVGPVCQQLGATDASVLQAPQVHDARSTTGTSVSTTSVATVGSVLTVLVTMPAGANRIIAARIVKSLTSLRMAELI